MDTVNYQRRGSRSESRRRSSESLQRKYNYRGVKTAIGFAALGAGAIYVVFLALGALVGVLTG